jgi:coenzyme Q-binding protein COQ10
MAKHTDRRFLPYTPAQMYNLVADVERYPEFLPWCVGARIRKRLEREILADLMIGFTIYRERFTSKVTLNPPGEILTEYTEGPFRYLKNRWSFEPHDGGCMVDFYVDFEFKSKILQTVITGFFEEAVRRMVAAFEARAKSLYGAPPASKAPSAS